MYRVIVVDDEMLIRKRICLGFDWESLGYEIAADTGDGEQALAMILSGNFDLAIVDIAMPQMPLNKSKPMVEQAIMETMVKRLTHNLEHMFGG